MNTEFSRKLFYYAFEQLVFAFGPDLASELKPSPQLPIHLTPVHLADYLPYSRPFDDPNLEPLRIGLALDFDEQELAYPDVEDTLEIFVTPKSTYRAPRQNQYNYHLEKMTKLLEEPREILGILPSIERVREMALSCGGGLGYLQGPDVNRFQGPTPRPAVFGDPNAARRIFDSPSQSRFQIPYKLEMAHRELAAKGVDPKEFPMRIAQLVKHEDTRMEDFLYERRISPPLPESRLSLDFGPYADGTFQLEPGAFTDAQARFLFQHMSAQQGIIQSFVITILENGTSMSRLSKINISRLPSYFLDQLCRDDFWSSVPQLEEVALGIVPDWRCLSQQDMGTVNVQQVYPTDAMPKVFKLLNDHIGTRPHIKRLHFEWICGGELAPGILQRNENVLPAPFLKEHRKVIHSDLTNLLILPHVTELSLKNCWFTPHVFYKIIRTMSKEHSLESLELETVSLSGPPVRQRVGRIPYTRHHEIGFYVPSLLNKLQTPERLSWSHIIDMLTPGPTVAQHIHERDNPLQLPLRIKKELKLRKLVFKSCGYVAIPDNRFIVNQTRFLYSVEYLNMVQRSAIASNKIWASMKRFVQISIDRHLGSIAPVLTAQEEDVLQEFFGFRIGWDQVYSPELIEAARCDGVAVPGLGRFTGTIEHDFPGPPPEVEGEMDEQEEKEYEIDLTEFDNDYDDNNRLEDIESEILHRIVHDEW